MSEPAVRQRIRTDYSVIFAILALFTAMEVGVGYLPSLPEGVRVGVLVFLAAVKVALVLLYFMHLKFDNRVFALPFALGLVLVVPLVLIVGLTIPKPTSQPASEQQAASQPSGPSGAQTITVTETTFKISLSADSVPAGQVTFHVANDATDLPHQLTIIKTDQPAGQLPVSQGQVDESQVDVVGKTDTISTSGNADLTLNLSPGHYALVCNVPGHYQAGMYADLTVTGGGGSTGGAGPTATPATPAAATGTPETTPATAPAASGTPEMTPTSSGQPTAEATQAAGATTVTATEDTFSIKLSPDSVQAGSVTFHVVNQAKELPHQLTVIRTDLPAGQLPVDANKEPQLDKLDVINKTNDLQPGQSAYLTVSLTPGHYVLICALPGHYSAGMYADFTVQGAAGTPAPAGSPTAAPTSAVTGTPSSQQAAGQATITVTETTFGLKPSPDTIPAGTITFHVINQATDIPHQLTVIRTDVAAAQLPVDSQDDPLMNQLDVVGQTDNIAPGQSADLTVNLSAGHYVLICALHGHYHAGMYADFTVQ
jgi:caa(3)-type oxidase subunit IV